MRRAQATMDVPSSGACPPYGRGGARPRACRNDGIGGVLARPPAAASSDASFHRSLSEFLLSRGAVRPPA
jgi:hypothetical protein